MSLAYPGMSIDHEALDELVVSWRDRAGRVDAGAEVRR
jgi:hypothetical protein